MSGPGGLWAIRNPWGFILKDQQTNTGAMRRMSQQLPLEVMPQAALFGPGCNQNEWLVARSVMGSRPLWLEGPGENVLRDSRGGHEQVHHLAHASRQTWPRRARAA